MLSRPLLRRIRPTRESPSCTSLREAVLVRVPSKVRALRNLALKIKKSLTLFNKIDIRTDDDPLQDFRADHVLQISATENAGLDAVKDVLQEMLREDKIYIERVIPYAQAGVLQLVRNKGELVSEEYVPEGISIRAYVPMEVYGKL